MEKIQQALERARQQRETNHKYVSDRQSHANEVEAIQYTKTQAVEVPSEQKREKRILSTIEHNEYSEAFKILSTHVIQRMSEHRWSSLAITSSNGDEGKTTTAINLCISIAKEIEYTVMLVDANLRNPGIHKHFGIQTKLGLSDYLTGDYELSDILVRPADIDHFVILPGGTPIVNSSEMLSSPKMCSLVEELKKRYPKRIIIFDLPPILNTADAVSFAPCIDCALIVIEDDVTKSSDLKKAVDLISVTNVLGTVLNKAKY